MVSTRQMATSGGTIGVVGGGNNVVSTTSAAADESQVRLTVVTRHSQYVPASCIAMSSSNVAQQQATNAPVAGPSMPATITPSSLVQARHSQLPQALKANGGAHLNNINSNNNNVMMILDGGGSNCILTPNSSQLHLFDLPTELLIKILSYTGYKKVSQCRLVSQKMNEVCMSMLNSTFSKLITATYNRFHTIKANMPRRESARRNHPLACESDIIETCYMRLSLLQMTLGKHIERGHCCFFPGAILDEVYTILKYISITPRLQRPYRVTDELFDLSTMAMEYFRDRIEPTLPDIAYFNRDFYKLNNATKRPSLVISSDLSDNSSNLQSPPQGHMVLRKGIRKIKQGMKIYNNQLSVLRTELRTCKRKSVEQGKQISEQQKLLAEQQKQTLEYANRLDENDKKNEEISRKFSTLLQELNKCKTELQFWRSKSPAIPICMSCNQKVSPVLQQEDYQALINQGVKHEDILIDLKDDTDTESDSSVVENQLVIDNEFVFPDEATTAKLLAVNTATKNLKRQYHGNTVTSFAATDIAISIPTSKGNTSSDCSSSSSGGINAAANYQPVNCKKDNEIMLKSNSFDTIAAGDCVLADKTGNIYQLDPTHATTSLEASSADRIQNQMGHDGCGGGYPPKLFYGNHQHQRGGVIVTPISMLAKQADINKLAVGSNNAPTVAADIGGSDPDESVSHETKKARRVQKATRCFNSNVKRGK